MNRAYISAIALTLAAFGASQAMADDAAPKTREQVRAEAAEALRNGDVMTEGGQKLNELYPGLYKNSSKPAQAAKPAKTEGKTREQVKAEAAEAVRNGDVMTESSQKANELYPGLFPAKPAPVAKSRDEVKAELREALRTGDMLAYGETDAKLKDLFPGRYPQAN